MIGDGLLMLPPKKSEIYPWLLQLGKGRGGWYLKRSCEQFMPKSWRGARHIEPAWQSLQPGQIVDDYGFGSQEYFEVVSVNDQESLVYVSDRLGTRFTWALLLHKVSDNKTEVHLRFRGRLQRESRWQRGLLSRGGDVLDWIFTEPMLDGLCERIQESK